MGTFSLPRTVRRRAAAVGLSLLALGAVGFGGATTASASATTASASATTAQASAGSAGTGCPATAVTAGASFSTASWAKNVPWHSVGRGWILADLAKSMSATGPGTLYLVSPGGHRYRLGTAPANATFDDWSGNGTNALFTIQGDTSTTVRIIALNLHTGRATSFKTYSGTTFPSISFSRPSGAAILFQGGASTSGGFLPLQRFSLTGVRQQCYPSQFARAGAVDGGYQENASGTEIVLGTANGLEVVSNNGQPIRPLALQKEQDSCQLLNWWNSQSVVVTCGAQLFAYPLSGARPDQLTSSRDPGTWVGAWHLPSGNYAEGAACGSTFLEKLNTNGTASLLTIPNAMNAGTVQPLGTYGARMPVLVGGGCDGHIAYSFVDWYNPATNTASPVVGGPAGGGYVTEALLFGTN